MMKVTEGLAVDLEAGGLSPRGDDLVISLVLGNGDILEHQVADGIQLLGALTLDLFELLLSKFNFLLDSVGLCLLLLALVLSLGLLHLLGNGLGDYAELLSQVWFSTSYLTIQQDFVRNCAIWHTLSPLFIDFDDLVNDGVVTEAGTLGSFHLLWVTSYKHGLKYTAREKSARVLG
jgi:hypothetical protein